MSGPRGRLPVFVTVAGALALLSGVIVAALVLVPAVGESLRGVVSVRCSPHPHTFDARTWDLSNGVLIGGRDLQVARPTASELVLVHGETGLVALCALGAGVALFRLSRSLLRDAVSLRRFAVRLEGVGWLCVLVMVAGPLMPYYASVAVLDRLGFSGQCGYVYSALSAIPAIIGALMFVAAGWLRRTGVGRVP
ncbi:hypothetical protein [Nonomuraea sp. NPDC050310]|uniref:hypothetical protein n=1 Tax=Nonomuraea sp. NPDC050310 TaxID=3154935 RepID=UPI0033F9D8DA